MVGDGGGKQAAHLSHGSEAREGVFSGVRSKESQVAFPPPLFGGWHRVNRASRRTCGGVFGYLSFVCRAGAVHLAVHLGLQKSVG